MNSPEATAGKNPTYERWRWQIFAITWLAYAGFYLTRKSFSVAKIAMGKEVAGGGLGMSNEFMGYVDMVYLIAYAVGQFIWGIAADKVGTRVVVLAGLFCSVLSAVAMGASTPVVLIGIFFCAQGLCQSTGWGPLSKNFGNFFSQHERGTMMGFWNTCYAVGGLVAGWYAGFCADQMHLWRVARYGEDVANQMQSWRWAFYGPAATLFVVCILFYLFQRNRPEDVGLPPIEKYHGEKALVLKEGEAPEAEPEGSWKVVWEVVSNPTVLTLCAVYFLLKPTRYAVLFWGAKYVNEKLNTSMTQSGLISGLFEAAGIVSCILGGWISDRVFGSRRMPVCVLCLAALGVFLFFFDSLPHTKLIMAAGFLLIGLLLFAPDSIVSGTAALDFGTRKGASTAAGFVNGFGSAAAVLGGMLPGFCTKVKPGQENIFNRMGISSWNGMFIVLGVMLILAALVQIPQWNALPKTVSGDRTS